MIIQRVAVFSDLDGKVYDRIAPALRSNQIIPVFVKLAGEDTYFDKLLARLAHVVDDVLRVGDRKVIALLCSSVSEGARLGKEAEAFFPVVRRMQLASVWRKDVNRGADIVKAVVSCFGEASTLELAREFKKPIDERLLLPIKNTNSNRLKSEMMSIYNLQQFRLTNKVDKDLNRVRNTRKIRIKGVDFLPCINGEQHPIRRCTDTIKCDVAAKLRFGFVVDARFEFDVSCEQGLKDKTFHLCGGSAHKISGRATHLNMRINDDFKEA